MAKSWIYSIPKSRKFLDEAAAYEGDDCLIWPYCKGKTGYGQVAIKRRNKPPHRVICERVHGAPPQAGMHAAHSCGNRACCNPRHLRWATVAENAQDRVIHGTAPRGSSIHFAKIAEADVATIRGLAGSLPQRLIAEQFGVTQSLVSKIVNRRIWTHV